MVSVLTVIAKDDESTLRKKYLLYDEYMVSEDDPTIKACIEETIQEFNGEPDDIKITISMTV